MKLNIGVEQQYTIRRIDSWSIEFYQNRIYGIIQPFGISIDTNVWGYILGWVDGHVMARINGRLYALVLGYVNPEKKDLKCLYKEYLRTKTPSINSIVI